MKLIKKSIQSALGLAICLPLFAHATPAQTPNQATAITQVFGDGVKLTAIAVAYPTPISQDDISIQDYQVQNRTVEKVFVSNEIGLTPSKTGNYAILQLSPNDPNTSLEYRIEMPNATVEDKPKGGTPWKAGDKLSKNIQYHTATASLNAHGTALNTQAVKNLIVDEFEQLTFRDPKTGKSLRYNLFVPKNQGNQPLPLVLFMHDAGTTSEYHRATLFQGLGAVIWADPAEQAKRPAIVLAPQYDEIIVDDHYQASAMLDTTIHLIEALKKQYPIDKKRIYVTGQSGGGMMSLAMNIKYPDYFAASYIVASKWGADLVPPIAKNKLWIMASVDDIGAFPSQNAITKTLENHGAKVSRAIWQGNWNKDEYRFAYDDLMSENSNIKYTIFAKGSVFKNGETAQTASGHRNTWRVAYSIEPIREWLFSQSKK